MKPVLHDQELELVATVISLARMCMGEPCGIQLRTPTRVGVRPVMSAVRDGEQLGWPE